VLEHLPSLPWLLFHQERISQRSSGVAKGSHAVVVETALLEAARFKTQIPSEQLTSIASTLKGLDPIAAGSIIRRFLSTGADAPTGQEFRLAADASLESAPTLRTFLP